MSLLYSSVLNQYAITGRWKSAALNEYAVLGADGFNLYKNAVSDGPVDFSSPVAFSPTLPITSPPLAFPFKHKFVVKRLNKGREDCSSDYITVELNAAGVRIYRPSAPDSIYSRAAFNGAFVQSVYYAKPDSAKADKADLFWDNGTGTIDWVTPVQTLDLVFGSDGNKALIDFDVTSLTPGTTYKFGIRSRNSTSGTSSDNTDFTFMTAEAPPPVVQTIAMQGAN